MSQIQTFADPGFGFAYKYAIQALKYTDEAEIIAFAMPYKRGGNPGDPTAGVSQCLDRYFDNITANTDASCTRLTQLGSTWTYAQVTHFYSLSSSLTLPCMQNKRYWMWTVGPERP